MSHRHSNNHSRGHHHHHHDDGCCSEESHHSCHSHEDSCCDEGHHHHHHDDADGFCHELLELADQAWMEVLKEKIKHRIASECHLDQLAEIIAKANHCRWKGKIAKQKGIHEYRRKVCEFFQNKN